MFKERGRGQRQSVEKVIKGEVREEEKAVVRCMGGEEERAGGYFYFGGRKRSSARREGGGVILGVISDAKTSQPSHIVSLR